MKNLILSLATITPLSAALSVAPSHTPVSIMGNDLIYDSSRDLLLASVPSSAGPQFGNSIVEIDPSTGAIVGSNFVGSEPGEISLNSDSSRIYVGIDGASGFRWLDSSSGTLSQITPLNGFVNNPSIVQSFAAVPGRPNEIAISLDATASSASGYLTLYRDSTRIIDGATLFDADQIAFASPDTLISYEDSSTGFRLISWTYDPSLETLTQNQSVGSLISGFSTRIEISGSNILASNGTVVDLNSLIGQGSLNITTNSAIQNVPGGDLYSLSSGNNFGGTTDEITLDTFDLNTFIQTDSIVLDADVSGSIVELIDAGRGRLAYISSTGDIGIISGVSVPEPSTTLLLFSLTTLLPYRRRA